MALFEVGPYSEAWNALPVRTMRQRMSYSVRLLATDFTEFDLPQVCVIRGTTEGVSFRPVSLKSERSSPAFGVVGLVIEALSGRSVKVKVLLPFSEPGYSSWRRCVICRRLLAPITLLGFFVVTPLLAYLAGPVAFLVGCGLTFVAAAYLSWRGRAPRLTVEGGPGDEVTLAMPSTEAALAIRLFLRGKVEAPIAPGSACMSHPSTAATYVCHRCGSFFCEACAHRASPGRVPLCEACWERRLSSRAGR